MSMFTGFHAYDDEGYFLITLRSYLSGEPLLNPTAPFYGPLFFEAMGGVFKLLALQPTHDAGRVVTLAVWLLASAVGGVGAYRLLRNLWLSAGVQLATFGILAALANEPIEPFGLTSLLLMLLVVAVAFRPTKPRAVALFIGAIVAALCLIKINIGGFAVIAVVFAWTAGLSDRWRRFLLPVAAVLMAATPFALTLSLLSREWVLVFAIVVAASLAAVALASVLSPPAGLRVASAPWTAYGGAVVAITSLGIAFAGGTTPGDVWNGLVVVPLRLPQLFVLPLAISPGYALWAALALLGSLAVLTGRLKLQGTTMGLFRVGAGFFTWLVLLLQPDTVFMLALPLAWLATQPPVGDADSPTDPYARLLLAALAPLESLQAYPAAGTQLSMAALPLLPVGAVILNDGVRQLRLAGARRPALLRVTAWVPRAAVSFNLLVAFLFALTAVAGFGTDTQLNLPGATSVRVPQAQATALVSLVAAIDQNCLGLVTLPGMNSLYLWSRQGDPPPELRSEIWWLTLDSEHQEALAEQLQAQPRLCVVRNQSLVDFWAQGHTVPDRPLVRFIDSGFYTAGTFGGYELLVRKPPG